MTAVLCGVFAVPAFAGDNTLLGTLGGAALGGFVGSQFGAGTGRLATTGAGVFVGGLLGNSIGSSMDRANRGYGGGYSGYGYAPYYSQSSYYEPLYVAPPAPPPPRVVYMQPQTVEYREREPAYTDGGYLGQISGPDSSRYCREYTQQIRIDGKIQESYGTACLQPDGSWRVER
jgi:surface antigen